MNNSYTLSLFCLFYFFSPFLEKINHLWPSINIENHCEDSLQKDIFDQNQLHNSSNSNSILNESFNLCDQTVTNSPTGFFYDPGGNGIYGNNDYCTLLIAPPCAQTITLIFTSFNTEGNTDFLKIYDGNNSSAPQIGNLSGDYNPASITSSGGELFIIWDSDSSLRRDGFRVYWHSVIGSDLAMTAIASANINNPAFGQTVDFSDLSTETPNSWLWDFGDGHVSTEQNPSHIYLSSGMQTVVLTTSNCVSTDTDTIYVDVQEPGVFSVNPSSLDIVFPNCEDSIVTDVWMYNTGYRPMTIATSSTIFTDDFENTINPDIWDSTTGVLNNICGSSSGNTALYFNGKPRHATTVPFSLNSNDSLGFYLHYGSVFSSCDAVESGKHVVLEYSIDGGTSFNIMDSYTNLNGYYSFTSIVAYPPVDAIGVPTMYRIRQPSYSGYGDNWSIDNFFIVGKTSNVASILPNPITIPQNDSVLVQVTVQRDQLAIGDYVAQYFIATNNPLIPQYTLPIHYTIQGDGLLSFEMPCIDFDTIQRLTSTVDSIYFYNTGCDNISINDLSTTNSFFQYPTLDTIIEPNDSILIGLSFNPTTIGTFNETLNFTYDGIDTSICLTAVSLGIPVINSITSLDVLFPDCEDSIVSNIWIYNTGNGPLDFQSNQGDINLDHFDQGTINPNIWASTTGVIRSFCGSNSGSSALYFNNNNTREAITHPMILDAGDQIGFSLLYGSGSSPCDNLESGKAVSIGYSINGGATYTNIQTFSSISDYHNFSSVLITIPPELEGISAIYRIRQSNFIGSGSDNWAIDDFFIQSNNNDYINNIANINPPASTIPQGDSLLVELIIHRNQLTLGDYNNVLSIKTNDPQHPIYNFNIDYSILGNGILSFQTACLSFDEIQEFDSNTNSVYLFNIGCDTILIDNINTSNPYFQHTITSHEIPPNDYMLLDITFSPLISGVFNDTLHFTYDGIDTTICLEAVSIGAPFIGLNPYTLDVIFPNCEDSIVTNVWISNTGNGTLEFEQKPTILTDDFEQNVVNPDIWDSTTGIPSDNCGSLSGNAALYFSNNTRQATTIPFSLSTNDSLGFYLIYGSSSLYYCNSINFPSIAPLLEYSIDGGISFNLIEHYNTNMSQYHNFTKIVINPPTDAINVPTQYRIRQPGISFWSTSSHWSIDDFFVSYSNDIISMFPDSGTIAQGDSLLVQVSIDRNGLTPGNYDTEYSIATNDPQQTEFILPINYTIQGQGILSFEMPCIDFGTIYEFDSVIDSIYFYNTGCVPIIIDNTTVSNPFFQYYAPVTTIEPDDSMLIELSFNPTVTGGFNETFDFTYDGIDTSICLTAVSESIPFISSNPTSLNLTIPNCENSKTSNLWLTNSGNVPLDFDVSPINYLDDFEQGTINSNIWASTTGVISNSCGSNSGNSALYFNDLLREAVTQPFSLGTDAKISFNLNYGSGNAPCEAVDIGKVVAIGYSINGGASYSNIQSFTTISNHYNFDQVVINIPTNAVNTPTIYRIRQTNFSGVGFDNWAIDDFQIKTNNNNNSPNVSIFPSSGSIPQGDSLLVEVTIHRDNLPEGVFDTNLFIYNHLQSSIYAIPINYTIEGSEYFENSFVCNPIYVDINASGMNDGTSWTDAFTDLQDALFVTGGNDTIHIAEGTYLPSQNGLRAANFNIPSGTILLGGYPTGGGVKDPNLYETILSGNIDNTSIDGDSYHVIIINNANNIEINGLTIRDGNADDATSYGRSRGGGLFISNSTVDLVDIEVKWNRAVLGGAIFTISSDITIQQSTFKKNRADNGAAIYYSNASNLNLYHSKVIDNTSNIRCALESNNAANTIIENCIIANNQSANANALGFIATNRNSSVQITNSTILGRIANKNIISVQVGIDDQMDMTINNSIVAHQDPSFDKNIIAFNNNVFNFNHNNCYFSGTSITGNGANTLFANTAGDLQLNPDYSVSNCSPVVNAGDNALAVGTTDIFGNPRFVANVDIGASEAQLVCREISDKEIIVDEVSTFNIYPNPTNKNVFVDLGKNDQEVSLTLRNILGQTIFQKNVNSTNQFQFEINGTAGIYLLEIKTEDGQIATFRILKN